MDVPSTKLTLKYLGLQEVGYKCDNKGFHKHEKVRSHLPNSCEPKYFKLGTPSHVKSDINPLYMQSVFFLLATKNQVSLLMKQ